MVADDTRSAGGPSAKYDDNMAFTIVESSNQHTMM